MNQKIKKSIFIDNINYRVIVQKDLMENTYIEEYFMSNTFYKYENNLNKKYNCTII